MDVGVHQTGQNGGVAEIGHGGVCGQLIQWDNVENSLVLDEHSRDYDSLGCHDTPREKCFETHI
jgi:hypothetical protein